MPLLNSMGIFRNMVTFNGGTNAYWFAATDMKLDEFGGPSAVMNSTSKIMNDKLYLFGNDVDVQGRPYYLRYTSNTGSLAEYKVFPKLPISTTNRYDVREVQVDSLGNTHILWNSNALIKYGSDGVFSIGKQLTGVDSLGESDSMVKDSSDNLYVLSFNSTYIILTKLTSSYVVVWSKKLVTGFGDYVSTANIKIDPFNNLYLVLEDPSTQINYLVKFDTSGNILWQKQASLTTSTARTIAFDSSGNIYLTSVWFASGTAFNLLIKLDPNGTKLEEHFIDIPNYIRTLDIDVNGDLVFAHASTSGIYVTRMTTSAVVLNTIFVEVSNMDNTLFQVTCSTTGTYLTYTITAGRTVSSTIKMPIDLSLMVSTTYSFTVVSDVGTSYPFSGTIDISSVADPSVYVSGFIIFATPAFSTSTEVITTSDVTQSLGPTTPFNYSEALV